MIDLLSNLSDDNTSSNQLTVVEEKNGNLKKAKLKELHM
jgi:hypothetical protein